MGVIMKKFQLIIIVGMLFLVSSIALAQDSCAITTQLEFSRAYATCNSLERNQACYGAGSVPLGYQPQSAVDGGSFAQAGDRLSLNHIFRIEVDSPDNDMWSIAFIRWQANLSTSSQRSVLGILFGIASLTNHIEPLPQMIAKPLGTVNIRALPQQNSDIIVKVGVNGELIVNGRNEDNTWLRVFVPNSDELGWISRDIVTVNDDINSLVLADVDDVIQHPFEDLTLNSSDIVPCEGTPMSGLLMQTPSLTDTVTITLNGATLDITGTAYIQAIRDDYLTIHMIEGTATVSAFDESVRLAGGTRLQIPIDSEGQISALSLELEPYDIKALQYIPYLYLDRRIQLIEALSAEAIAELGILIAPIAEPTIAPSENSCQYRVTSNQNIRSGPSLDYNITQAITSQSRVYPRSQTLDINGTVWLQIGQQSWIQARVVESDGECTILPSIADEYIATAKRNTYTLEDCRASNGMIEVGQRVTLEFTPMAWENFASAQEATRYNRGEILVEDRNLYPWVSEPIKISEHEYIRRFSAEWIAELGTHRIEGNHYSYEVICILTVVPSS